MKVVEAKAQLQASAELRLEAVFEHTELNNFEVSFM